MGEKKTMKSIVTQPELVVKLWRPVLPRKIRVKFMKKRCTRRIGRLTTGEIGATAHHQKMKREENDQGGAGIKVATQMIVHQVMIVLKSTLDHEIERKDLLKKRRAGENTPNITSTDTEIRPPEIIITLEKIVQYPRERNIGGEIENGILFPWFHFVS